MLTSHDSTIINLPIEKVMDIFKNQHYFKDWQKNLVSFENTSKTIGNVGSTRSMVLKIAGTRITMDENITVVNLPHVWEAVYRTTGVVNRQTNMFSEIMTEDGTKTTQWEAKSTYKFTGMMRLVSSAKPDLFSGQTKELMHDFKIFAESL
jgi:hypothetical protein